MSRRVLVFLAAVVSVGAGFAPIAPAQSGPEYGPAKGTLVIVGGGSTQGTGIMERFIELGGGPDGTFVIVPTAGGNRTADGQIRQYNEEQIVGSWLRRGLKNVKMVHTHDPAVANTEEFVKPIREATAVWFNGGRQWNIVDSYAGTLALQEFHKVLERGGVVGGSSAGATIQGHYLVRGDTSGPNVVMTEESNHQNGFAFLRKTAIDQHIDARNRWDDLVPVIKKYPELLGIGLSEGTAIIVSGDRFEVMGKWKVAIHDASRTHQPWEKSYFVVSPGDIYDMRTKTVTPAPETTAKTGTGGRGGF
jgi:cyanophycinase